MAGRIRSIKPELIEDEKIANLSDAAWRLFVSTWLIADDYGNARAGDRFLASQVWQDTGQTKKAKNALVELVTAGRIHVYEVEGERYLSVPRWSRHQRVDNAGKPRVPGPPADVLESSRRFAETRGESPLGSGLTTDPRPPTDDPRTPTARTEPGTSQDDIDELLLSEVELAAASAIVADESLVLIVPRPRHCAKDLVAIGPGIDVAYQIKRAGAWLRADPKRQKKNGPKFLANWMTKEQERRRDQSGPRNSKQPVMGQRDWTCPDSEWERT